MALRILTAGEVGAKVAEVLRRVGMGSVEMSLAMGRDKQFISRWTTGRRKRLDRGELIEIANFAEGKGDFAQTEARVILAFLDGDFDDWGVELRPNLRLAEDDGRPQLDVLTYKPFVSQVAKAELDASIRKPSFQQRAA